MSIQKQIDWLDFASEKIEVVTHDLCVVLVPEFFDADPTETAFGSELYVPFSSMLDFEVLPARR